MTMLLVFAVAWALSSLTLTTGVGGGALFVPLLVLALGVDLRIAVATGVVTQLAGISTTTVGHAVDRRVDVSLAVRLGGAAVGGVVLSRVVVDVIPGSVFGAFFVVAMIGVALWIGTHPLPSPTASGARPFPPAAPDRARTPRYPFCQPGHGYALAVLAGTATVLGISGAEIQISALILRCRVPIRGAIATGAAATTLALVAAATAVVASGDVAWHLAAASVPAAAAGALTARSIVRFLPETSFRLGLAALMLVSATAVAVRSVL